MADFDFEYTNRLKQAAREQDGALMSDMLNRAGLDSNGDPVKNWTPPPPPPAPPAPKPGAVSQFTGGLVPGLREGTATVIKDVGKVAHVLDNAATWINKHVNSTSLGDLVTGPTQQGAFGMLADTLDSLSQYVAPSENDLKDKDTFAAYLGRAIGAAPPTVAEYMSGTKLVGSSVGAFALIESIKNSDQGTWAAIKGFVKGAIVGRVFEGLQQYSRLIRAGGTAALFGGEAALSGATGAQIGASAAAGALLGAVTPNKPGEAPKVAEGQPAAPTAIIPEVLPPTGGAGRVETIRPSEAQDIGLGPTGKGGVIQGQRLGLPAPAATPESAQAQLAIPDLRTRIAGYLPKGRVADMIDQAVAKTNAEADIFLEQKMSTANSKGLEDFIAKDIETQKALDAKAAEAPRLAAKIEVAANEVGVDPQMVLKAAKIAERVRLSDAEIQDRIDALIKGKLGAGKRTSPAEGANMIAAVKSENSPETVFTVAVDQKLPRDVRQNAVNRILELDPKAVTNYIGQSENVAILKKISRGAFGSIIQLKAKARLEQLKKAGVDTTAEEPATSEAGFSRTDLNLLIAKALAGGLYGYSQGDTTEEKIRNALAGAGLAAMLPTSWITKAVQTFKRVDPQGARAAQLRSQGNSPGIDQAVPRSINPNVLKMVDELIQAKREGKVPEGRVEGINFDHINTPADVKVVTAKLAEMFHEGMSKARKLNPETGEGVSHEQTMYEARKLAFDLGMTEADVMFWPEGKPMTTPELKAAQFVVANSMEELNKALDAYMVNKETGAAGLLDRITKHALISTTWVGQTSEVARRLESLKIDVAGPEVVFIKHVGDVFQSMDRTGWTLDRLANGLQDLREDYKRTSFVRQMSKPGITDALLDLWYGVSLLSNPKTLAVNMIGTPIALGWQVGKRYIAAGITQAMGKTGDPSYVQWNEPMNMMWGIREGYKAAWQAASDAFNQGKITVGASGKFQTAKPGAFKAEAFNVDPSSYLGIGLDKLGYYARTFPRVMLATDQFLEVVGYNMELGARVAREAASKTSDPIEMAKLIREGMIENNVPPGIKEAATKFAVYNSFNDEAGSFIASLQKGIESLKTSNPTMGPAYYLLAKSVAPFITIPTNIAKWTVREGPLAVLSQNFYNSVARGGAEAQNAIAGVVLGSTVMATAAYLAKEGIINNGGTTLDPNTRRIMQASGWKPDSIKIGDTYYKIDRLDPIAMPLFWSADIAEIAGHLSDADYFQLAASAAMAITRPLSNKTYLQGMSDFFQAVFSGEPRKTQRFLSGEGASIVPGIVRGVRQQMDPYQRQVQTMLDSFKNQIPGASKSLPPVTDVFGRPIPTGYGAGNEFVNAFSIINPIAYTKEVDNPVIKEILDNKVNISSPRDSIMGPGDNPYDFKPADAHNGIPLEPWEFYAYKKIAGDWFMEKMNEKISQDSYKNASPGPDGGKAEIIRRLVAQSREYARGQMFEQFPGILDAVQEQLKARARALQPTGVTQ